MLYYTYRTSLDISHGGIIEAMDTNLLEVAGVLNYAVHAKSYAVEYTYCTVQYVYCAGCCIE